MYKAFLVTCFAVLAFLFSKEAKSQVFVFDSYTSVSESGKDLINPFTGGLNNPQIWNIQLNDDALSDMMIFDRDGGKVITFINDGSGGVNAFKHAPEYQGFFPQIQHFVVTADFNCDGLEDLFVSHEDGIKVYRALIVDGHISFEVETEMLMYSEAGFSFELSVGIIDIPAIVDVNMDGDLDVLTFKLVGGFVDYFENQSVENGDDCGALDFLHESSCWGDFYESGIYKSVILDSTCTGRYGNGRAEGGSLHAGSTFMIFDEDNDGLNDVVLGDLNFQNLNFLRNGGTSDQAFIVEQDTIFPGYNVPVDLTTFPAPFLFDADNDGKKDMLVAPNKDGFSINTNNILYYQNISPDDTYQFSYQNDTIYTASMIDVGTGSKPVFFDHNNDNLMDLVIGNFGYFEAGNFVGRLALYENSGSADAPVYNLVTRNYANMEIYGFKGLHTTYGDLDNDGDKDMIVGEEDGFIHYFRNIATPGDAASFVLLGPNYQGIDVGKFSTPQLIDANNDGLLDLIIGEQNGNLNYYVNVGTADDPLFELVTENLGGVDVREPGFLTGHSAPWLLKDETDDLTLYVGAENGKIFKYLPTSIDEELFTLETNFLSDIDEGEKASISLMDITGDDVPELAIGNERGGITFYRDKETVNGINLMELANSIELFPVPAEGVIYLKTGGISVARYEIRDLSGRRILEGVLNGLDVESINIGSLKAGVYLFTLVNDRGIQLATKRIITL